MKGLSKILDWKGFSKGSLQGLICCLRDLAKDCVKHRHWKSAMVCHLAYLEGGHISTALDISRPYQWVVYRSILP